jgi:hypothetical protein
MKKYVMLFCGLFLFASICFAEERDLGKQNGYDWEGFNLWQKAGYASGFINGTAKAYGELYWYVHTSKFQLKDNPIKIEELIPVWKVTIGQIVEGVDAFYNDYKNKQILIQDAIYVVCKEVKGESQEKIEREKQILRMPQEKQAVERSKDFIKTEIRKGTYSNFELKDGAVIDKKSQKEISLETQEDIDNFWKIAFATPVAESKKVSFVPDQQSNASQNSSGYIISFLLIGCAIFAYLYFKGKKK